ncbi:MAG: adenosylcobinamide-phosphate synthase CbiB [Planctomycetes bacterium]|nr:adenosylcobinamide-phosphate synthase CbiB [Planctomycetota bacterium]
MEIAIAMLAGFILDLMIGDPDWLPHPIIGIGKMISCGESRLRKIAGTTAFGEFVAGAALVLAVCALACGIAWLAVAAAGAVHPLLRLAVESIICFQMLAAKSLAGAAKSVWQPLRQGDLAGARQAVGMIVGRDTAELDSAGVAKAAVETVAENTSDGVVAPLLYFAIGGAPLAVLYKAINTMDSMLGYNNDRYRYFGRFAARLDDVANFIPARLSGAALVVSAAFCRMDWRNAWRILRRDRLYHSSPNSGHPEAAVAGALGVRLGGVSRYGGVAVEKPYIGDDARAIRADDILATNALMLGAAIVAVVACCAFRMAFCL